MIIAMVNARSTNGLTTKSFSYLFITEDSNLAKQRKILHIYNHAQKIFENVIFAL